MRVGTGVLELEGGPDLRLFAASIQSWRHDPGDWPRILDAVCSLGFTAVDVYVPWSIHAPDGGVASFEGRLDVVAFLRLAHDRGLRAVVRPGPHSGTELPDGGIPRAAWSDPATQALRCTGVPYALPTATHHMLVPSYASTAYLDRVEGWYEQVIPVLAPLQWPDGPIVLSQVDNELGYFFQAHPYALDYHPESVAGWRAFVTAVFGGADEARAALGVADLEPPRDGGDGSEALRVSWIAWREELLRRALAWLGTRQRAHGMTRVPLYHNDFPRLDTPLDQGALERSGAVDIAAIDMYSERHGTPYIVDIVRHVRAASRFPWLAESGAGWLALPWLLPMAVEPRDTRVTTGAALLAGAHGLTAYMAVERDRWYGSPIDRRGHVREAGGTVFRDLAAMREALRLEELVPAADVLVVESRVDQRRRAGRSILGGAVPAYAGQAPFEFRLTQPPSETDADVDAARRNVEAALREAGVPYDRAVSSSLPPLARYGLVVVLSAGGLERAAVAALQEAAAAGVRVVCMPLTPVVDEWLRPLAGVSFEGSLGLLPEPRWQCDTADVLVLPWQSGTREVVGLVRLADGDVDIELRGPVRAGDGVVAVVGAASVARDGVVSVRLPEWDFSVVEVRRP